MSKTIIFLLLIISIIASINIEITARERRAETSPKITQPLNIVCLGGSNTAGATPTVTTLVPITETYCNKLQAYMPTAIITNAGVAGDYATKVKARLATDLYPKAKAGYKNIVTLMLAFNDIYGGVSVNNAFAMFQDLANTIKANGWELYIMTYPLTEWTTGINDIIKEFNNKIETTPNLAFRIIKTDGKVGLPGDHLPDLLHLNSTGHSKIAEILAGSRLGQANISI